MISIVITSLKLLPLFAIAFGSGIYLGIKISYNKLENEYKSKLIYEQSLSDGLILYKKDLNYKITILNENIDELKCQLYFKELFSNTIR